MINQFVETDGLSRSVLAILLMTTIGCFTYTWGYYEGINNVKMQVFLNHEHEVVKSNEVLKAAQSAGHNLLSTSLPTGEGHLAGLQGKATEEQGSISNLDPTRPLSSKRTVSRRLHFTESRSNDVGASAAVKLPIRDMPETPRGVRRAQVTAARWTEDHINEDRRASNAA